MQEMLEELAKKHYENFPVGSRLIPRKYRRPIHLIYAFARIADDIADEGAMSSADRLVRLNEWEGELLRHLEGKGNVDFFRQLTEVIRHYNLPPQLFFDLLKAFKQDSSNPLYGSFPEILEYCRYSANPIGRLLLKIFSSDNDDNDERSDDICTALQLTNFWQDISVDTRRNRFYIPLSDLQQFGLEYSDLKGEGSSAAFQQLMQHYVDRTRDLFFRGKPLIDRVHKDFRLELTLVWHGGMRILEKIETLGYDTRLTRPTLTKTDAVLIFIRAFRS